MYRFSDLLSSVSSTDVFDEVNSEKRYDALEKHYKTLLYCKFNTENAIFINEHHLQTTTYFKNKDFGYKFERGNINILDFLETDSAIVSILSIHTAEKENLENIVFECVTLKLNSKTHVNDFVFVNCPIQYVSIYSENSDKSFHFLYEDRKFREMVVDDLDYLFRIIYFTRPIRLRRPKIRNIPAWLEILAKKLTKLNKINKYYEILKGQESENKKKLEIKKDEIKNKIALFTLTIFVINIIFSVFLIFYYRSVFKQFFHKRKFFYCNSVSK